MEGRKKQPGSSSSTSSFTSELFGSKESSSSSGIFGSILAPSSKVMGRESVRAEGVEKQRQDPTTQYWHSRMEISEDTWKRSGEGSQGTPNRVMSSYNQEEKVQPCHYSSSIYYGGQDFYSHPYSTQSSTYTFVNKDGGEDDSGSVSRGNWWQGSLYY